MSQPNTPLPVVHAVGEVWEIPGVRTLVLSTSEHRGAPLLAIAQPTGQRSCDASVPRGHDADATPPAEFDYCIDCIATVRAWVRSGRLSAGSILSVPWMTEAGVRIDGRGPEDVVIRCRELRAEQTAASREAEFSTLDLAG